MTELEGLLETRQRLSQPMQQQENPNLLIGQSVVINEPHSIMRGIVGTVHGTTSLGWVEVRLQNGNVITLKAGHLCPVEKI